MAKKLIDRRKYKEIKAMDHVQMSNFFYKLCDNSYSDGYKKGIAASSSTCLTLEEIEKTMRGIKGIGEQRLKLVMAECEQVIREKSNA